MRMISDAIIHRWNDGCFKFFTFFFAKSALNVRRSFGAIRTSTLYKNELALGNIENDDFLRKRCCFQKKRQVIYDNT